MPPTPQEMDAMIQADNTDETWKQRRRIADIDALFESATGWGSWMVTAANEREELVNHCNKYGANLKHKHLARTANGQRTD